MTSERPSSGKPSAPFANPVLWFDSAAPPAFPRFRGNLETDVVVVGGGIVGLTAAELLRREGSRVVVVEAWRLASGTTGRSSAHLTEVPELDYLELLEKFGAERARLFCQAARAGFERVGTLIHELGLDCEYARIPAYHYADIGCGTDLVEEFQAARDLGVDCAWTLEPPLPFAVRGAIQFGDQARFHPVKYISGVAEAFVRRGGRIFEDTRVRRVDPDVEISVVTDDGVIVARNVILATHTPPGVSRLHLELTPYRSALVAMPLLRTGPDALFWDSETPYHYVRCHRDDMADYLVVGGEDFKAGEASTRSDAYARLEAWARARFDVGPPTHAWCAQFYEPADGAPYIGREPREHRVYAATGLSGSGLAMGTAAAMLLCDSVLDRPNEWNELLAASRLAPLAGGPQVVKKAFGDAMQVMRDRILGPEADSIADIVPGDGRIVSLNGEKVAAFRDDSGTVGVLSAKCTHLGCQVRWNELERSWDCPCHGSRFTVEGKIVEGPALEDLGQAKALERPFEGAKGRGPSKEGVSS